MVAVLVTHTPHDLPLQLSHHQALLLQRQHLQSLLNDSAAVHLKGQRQHVPLYHTCQGFQHFLQPGQQQGVRSGNSEGWIA